MMQHQTHVGIRVRQHPSKELQTFVEFATSTCGFIGAPFAFCMPGLCTAKAFL